MIKTIVVDDEIILRESLKRLIEFDNEISVVGCGGNGFEAVELCETFTPEIVLMDIIMPNCDGIEGTRLIKAKFPSIKVLILTTFDDDENIAKALQNGADGYVLKSITPDDLVLAIKSVAKGMGIMHKKIFNTVAKQFEAGENNGAKVSVPPGNLSPRELSLLRYIVHGKSNKEIAAELFLAEGTVKNLVASLLEKLALKDRTQLAVYAVVNHLV
ncbi:MAG TPA: response regulator transcription factor [Bacillota bacterium]|nr:response regulator transcription factor [Bacillota bacterium]